MKELHCKNCEQVLAEDSKFCHQCGQSTRVYDEKFWSVASSYLHELLDIDGRMFRTLKVLITQPGELSRAFNQGQRVFYSPPLRLYLVVSIVFFLVFAYLGPDYSTAHSTSASVTDYYARAMFVLFPLFALLIQVFHLNTSYLGNLVFSLHIHTLMYLVLMINMPLEAIETMHTVFIVLQIPLLIFMVWYYLKAFHHVYKDSWLKVILKSSAIFFIYMSFMGIAFDVIIKQL